MKNNNIQIESSEDENYYDKTNITNNMNQISDTKSIEEKEDIFSCELTDLKKDLNNNTIYENQNNINNNLQNNENNKVIPNIDINKVSEFMNEFIIMKMHVSNIEKELNNTKEELNEKLNKTNGELDKVKIKNEQLSNKILI